MRRIEWGVQVVLAAGLVAAIIWGCRPAGAGGALRRGCERHLRLCATCRALGLTPERMLARATPTACLASGPLDAAQPPAYQLMPTNAGQ